MVPLVRPGLALRVARENSTRPAPVILRSIPRIQRGPSYRGRVLVYAKAGVLRATKWPKKRGRPKSALQRWWNDWFTQANLLAKYADPMSQVRAIAMTKGTGLYPRDVLLSAMRGRLYWWADETGWKWFPMAATQDVSNSLDTLAQTIGSVLVRAVDRWRAPVPGIVGQVLTYQGPAAAPTWEAGGGGGGTVQEDLPGTPIVPDNTQIQYDLDISAYASVQIDVDNVGFEVSSRPQIRLSIDGGLTFKAGAADYDSGFITASADGYGTQDFWDLSPGSQKAGHNGNLWLTNLRAGRCLMQAGISSSVVVTQFTSGRFNFDGPITHVRIYSLGARKFNAGVIRVVGQR